MASSSSPCVPLQKNWAELPQELISSILLLLDVDDILINVQSVCRSWRRVCRDPSMWRKIDLRNIYTFCIPYFDILCCEAVEFSQGGLLEINSSNFGSDDLLTYIAHRSPNLRSLALSMYFKMTNEGLVNAIAKLPLLETLEISHSVRKLNLKAIGQDCPQLQTLKLNSSGYKYPGRCDDYALEIAECMKELRHLQLIGDRITDTGLNAILDNLHHLKHLDLRRCFNINLVGSLEKRCLEIVKELRRPEDSTGVCATWCNLDR